MKTEGTQPIGHRHRRPPALTGIAAAIPLRRNLVVLLCLVGSAVAEGIGITSLIPLLVTAGDPDEGKGSGLGRFVIDTLQAAGLPTDRLSLVLVLITGMCLKALLLLLATRQVGYAVAEVGTRMRLGFITALLQARWSYFVSQPLGRFANTLSFESLRASEAYNALTQCVSGVIQAVIYVVIAAVVSWKLAAGALVIGAALMLSLNRFVIITKRHARKQTKRTKVLIRRLADVLIGLKPMKAMAREGQFERLFLKDIRAIDKAMRRQVFARQTGRALEEPIIVIFVGIGIYVVTTFATIPLGELVVMSLLLAKTVAVIAKIQEDLQAVAAAESGYWGIRDAIAEAAAAREQVGGGRAPALARGIEFRGVSMTYGTKPVLRDVSFDIPAGGITAIVGPSGAGKTTLVDLVLGLYRPVAGEILVDGTPLAEIDLLQWRGMVGYVPQELILYHDTIRANVALGETRFTQEDVERALRQAGAWEFVEPLADRIDHVVGERGGMLSGGQRQRIALARALVHRPKLLILDEATSALDPANEAAIVRNVRKLADAGGITVLSISHQAAWMAVADKVVRIEDGAVSAVPVVRPRVALQ
ncbi:MAG: ABC transporter ATP-binding protein [Rhodospirillaceae bacterium]|nr:ABC transporter ATP-binding protein [Rhodospirillaceae bacterium]